MKKRHLAVPDNDPEAFFIEDSEAAIAHALINNVSIKFYEVELSADGVPRIFPEAVRTQTGGCNGR